MGKYSHHWANTQKKIQTYSQLLFGDRYNAFLTFFEKSNQQVLLAVKMFREAYPNIEDDDFDDILEKFKNDMMLEMKYTEKMKEFVAYFQMYLDVEHSKMEEDGNTALARQVIKDWLACTPGMADLLKPKKDGPLVAINSNNQTTTNNLNIDHTLRLEQLPQKWQELAKEILNKKMLALEQKKQVIDIKVEDKALDMLFEEKSNEER